MYLLIACAGSWLVLLGSLCTAWAQLPQPRTTNDLVVITIIGAAAVAFSRLGLVSLLTLLLRLLPSGRFRALLADCLVRAMPRLLASSVLAAVSAGLVVQAAQAAPVAGDLGDAMPAAGPYTVTAAPADPGWPTVEGGASAADGEYSDGDAPADEDLHDPAWPTEPPKEAAAPPEDPSAPPRTDHREPADDVHDPAAAEDPESRPDAAAPSPTVHVVEPGESLWSIAAELVDAPEDTPQLVDDVYTANREIIGPDPSLIIAGQRLEIQP